MVLFETHRVCNRFGQLGAGKGELVESSVVRQCFLQIPSSDHRSQLLPPDRTAADQSHVRTGPLRKDVGDQIAQIGLLIAAGMG